MGVYDQIDNWQKLSAFLRQLPATVPLNGHEKVKFSFDMSEFFTVLHDGKCSYLDPNDSVDFLEGHDESDCGAVCCALGCGPFAGIPTDNESYWEDYFENNFGEFVDDGLNREEMPESMRLTTAAYDWVFKGLWECFDQSPIGAAGRIDVMIKLRPDFLTLEAWFNARRQTQVSGWYRPGNLNPPYPSFDPLDLLPPERLLERGITPDRAARLMMLASYLRRRPKPDAQFYAGQYFSHPERIGDVQNLNYAAEKVFLDHYDENTFCAAGMALLAGFKPVDSDAGNWIKFVNRNFVTKEPTRPRNGNEYDFMFGSLSQSPHESAERIRLVLTAEEIPFTTF